MSWLIDGVLFSGTIITFGIGKDYPATINGWAAAAAAHPSEDILCLCDATSGLGSHYPLAFNLEDNYLRNCRLPRSGNRTFVFGDVI